MLLHTYLLRSRQMYKHVAYPMALPHSHLLDLMELETILQFLVQLEIFSHLDLVLMFLLLMLTMLLAPTI